MRKHRKWAAFLLAGTLLLGLAACGTGPEEAASAQETVSENPDRKIVDSLGNEAVLPEEPRVVSLYGSYAECWALSGGSLVGVTEDAAEERGMELTDGMELVGSVKEPSLEKIVSLEPDYVLMSADLAPHLQLQDSLEQMGIGCGYFQMDTFEEYRFAMEQFCAVNGREDLLEKNVNAPGRHIEKILSSVPDGEKAPEVLLLRAYSTGMKAKKDDNLAGVILKELGCHNIAEDYPAMMEDLSLEMIVERDPEYIFVLTMGDEKKAVEYLDAQIAENPAWNGLKAVKEGHFVILPKDLFHYKPNERWDESYEYLAEIVYP